VRCSLSMFQRVASPGCGRHWMGYKVSYTDGACSRIWAPRYNPAEAQVQVQAGDAGVVSPSQAAGSHRRYCRQQAC
jgi:hypothetical protein